VRRIGVLMTHAASDPDYQVYVVGNDHKTDGD
jgi:hypothetical protein